MTGVWKGAFVDDTFRMSLSRFQLVIWTAMIVAALGVMAVERAERSPHNALGIRVPETVWILLGISATSLIGAPLIKKTKEEQPVDQNKVNHLIAHQDQNLDSAQNVFARGPVIQNRTIQDASVADMFMGDWVDDFNVLDVSKIQLFLFTGVISLGYRRKERPHSA